MPHNGIGLVVLGQARKSSLLSIMRLELHAAISCLMHGVSWTLNSTVAGRVITTVITVTAARYVTVCLTRLRCMTAN